MLWCVGASLVCVGSWLVVYVYVMLFQVSLPSVRLRLHQYCVLGVVRLVLVCVMFVLLVMVVLEANCVHVPELLLHHVAFMVSTVLLSLHITYSWVVAGQIFVDPDVGASPVWYGVWLGSAMVVRRYVVFV